MSSSQKLLDIAVKVAKQPGHENGEDTVAKDVPRGAVLRFSPLARDAVKANPEMKTLVMEGKVYIKALFIYIQLTKMCKALM